MFSSNTTKRWFTLDIVNATFAYSSAKGKANSKKSIAIRDITGLDQEPTWAAGAKDKKKEWGYGFEVVTRERTFKMWAQNEPELEMWVLAFQTLLKFRKGERGEGEEEEDQKQEDESEEEVAKRLKEKESELLKKIEQVDLYRKKNGRRPSNKTLDDLVKGDQSEELLEKDQKSEGESGEEKEEQDQDSMSVSQKKGRPDDEPTPCQQPLNMDPNALDEKKAFHDLNPGIDLNSDDPFEGMDPNQRRELMNKKLMGAKPESTYIRSATIPKPEPVKKESTKPLEELLAQTGEKSMLEKWEKDLQRKQTQHIETLPKEKKNEPVQRAKTDQFSSEWDVEDTTPKPAVR